MLSHYSSNKPTQVLAIESVDMEIVATVLHEVRDWFAGPEVDRKTIVYNDVRRGLPFPSNSEISSWAQLTEHTINTVVAMSVRFM